MAEAAHSFKTALSAPGLPAKAPSFYLNLLESLIDLCIRLGEPQTAEDHQRQGRDLIKRLLQDDRLSHTQKQSFAFIASRFDQLSVDSLIQQNQLSEALSTAETGKKLCLQWLLRLDEIPPLDLTQLQLRPHQAIVYWHLSPSRLTTFLLLPGDTTPRLIPLSAPQSPNSNPEHPDWLQQQLAWETWLQQWNQDYTDYSRLNKSAAKENHPWRQKMAQRLTQLSNLLNVDAIQTELSQSQISENPISELLLVPHRDLHRFPLHTLLRRLHLPLSPPSPATNCRGDSSTATARAAAHHRKPKARSRHRRQRHQSTRRSALRRTRSRMPAPACSPTALRHTQRRQRHQSPTSVNPCRQLPTATLQRPRHLQRQHPRPVLPVPLRRRPLHAHRHRSARSPPSPPSHPRRLRNRHHRQRNHHRRIHRPRQRLPQRWREIRPQHALARRIRSQYGINR